MTDTSGETTETGGGLYATMKVYDAETNECFHLKMVEDEIYIFPVDEDFSLSTFMRFYEFVCEYIDHRAEPSTAVGD